MTASASVQSEEITRLVTIVNVKGLHARASAKFVSVAELWAADISVTYEQETVPACSIMGLMMLGAGVGATITLRATGPQAEEALSALAELVEAGFDEGE